MRDSRASRNVRDLAIMCWIFCAAIFLLAQGFTLKTLVENWRVQRPPDMFFVYFYSMGRMFDRYPPAELYDYELQKKVCMEVHPLQSKVYAPNPYSPVIGVLFRPFARMNFFVAALLWIAISFCLYLTGLWLVSARFFRGPPIQRSLIFCFALVFWPFLHFLTSGQIAMIGFFALALALYEEDRGRPVLSGVALSLCLYKPTLLLLFVPMLFVTKRFKTLVGFASGAIAQVFLVTLVEGPSVWPAYLRLLFSFGSAAAKRTQQGFTIYSAYYVDVVSFFSIFPGGRSWLGRGLLLACVGCAGWAVLRAWRRHAGAGDAANTLIWAATLAWTPVLNTYVGIWDSTPVVLSVVATGAALKQIGDGRLYRRFTLVWVMILVCSWMAAGVAQATGFQILTVLFAALGTLQLVALRRVQAIELKQDEGSGAGHLLTEAHEDWATAEV